jgi:hypothetical protein
LLVMVANNTGREARRLLERFPERIGHIYSPDGWRRPWPNYALDNGGFTSGKAWEPGPFLRLIDRAIEAEHQPRWLAVPDVVANREATLQSWQKWAPVLRQCGFPLAFVVQDGMIPADLPADADVIFVGGTTDWKRSTAGVWCHAHPRVHIGRVNGEKDLWRYHRLGAESCDGSGWFRGDRRQLDGLWYYLADSEGLNDHAHGPMQPRFSLNQE